MSEIKLMQKTLPYHRYQRELVNPICYLLMVPLLAVTFSSLLAYSNKIDS